MKVLICTAVANMSLKAGLRQEDFQSQLGKGLVQCPLCGDDQIQKASASAPEFARFGVSQCAGAHRRTFATASATLRRFAGCGVAAADAAKRCSV